MSFNSALTAGNYTSLRGSASVSPSHSATLYVSVCPNNNVYTARVNQAVFSASFAQVSYDGGSGTLANVRAGMTVLISHTNSRSAAFFAGRIRKAPTASIFYINETSAPVTDNDYIFVIDDYRIWDKLARFVDPTLYPDYEVSFRQLLPRIYGLRSAYVIATDGSDGTFSFAPSVAASTSGASISTYLWEVGDGTITVGTSSTQNITATFPPGFRWVHFTATDNGNRASTRHIPVWVHDDANPPAPLEIGDFEWSATVDDGFSGSLPTFDGVDSILDNTLILAWVDQERYNGTLTNIVNNIVLLGRFRNEKSSTTFSETGQQDATTRFDIEGPLQTLSRLEINPVEIITQSSPDSFCEIKDCTPWREAFLVLSEFSTFHELHSVDFDSTDTTYADIGVTAPLGSILNAVNSNLYSLNAQLQINAAGQSEGIRDAVIIPTASRAALVTVANWTTADILDIDYEHDEVNIVGRSMGSGGSYNTTSGKITATNSIAPGIAQDYPEGSTALDRQVLAANQNKTQAADELNIRNGHWLARAQGFDTLTVDHPDGYWWLTPSNNQWYTFTLDGSETTRGIILDTNTRWMLAEVRGTYNLDTGTFDVQATYHKETSGASGQTIVYPPQTITPLKLPTLPPIPPFPAFDIGDFFLPDDIVSPSIVPPSLFGSLNGTPKHDGNTVIVWSALGVWACNDFLSQLTPTWVEITPPITANEAIVACRLLNTSPPSVTVVTAGTPTASDTWEHVFDFTQGDGGFVPDTDNLLVWDSLAGTHVSGSGWHVTAATRNAPFTDENTRHLLIVLTLPGNVTAKSVSAVYDYTRGTFVTPHIAFNAIFLNGSNVASVYADDDVSGSGKTLSSGISSFTFSKIQADMACSWTGGGDPADGDLLLKSITFTGDGADPFGPGGTPGGRIYNLQNVFGVASHWVSYDLPEMVPNVMRIGNTVNDIFLYDQAAGEVYYSSNRGASWSTAITVGTPPASDGGFDTARLGTVSIGAADGMARIATTQGGSYSDYATIPTDNVATAIYIPRYTFLGANNGIGVSTPDFLFASETPAAGTGNTLWTVTVGGSVFGNISPADGGNKGTAVSPNCIHIPWYSAAYQDIMAILDFAGTRKLAVSDDGGSNWVITGALAASAAYLTTRRTDTQRRQLFIVNGSNLGYCSNYRSNPLILAARIGPSADTLLGIDVLP